MGIDIISESIDESERLRGLERELGTLLPKFRVDFVEIAPNELYRVRVTQENGDESKILYESETFEASESEDFVRGICNYLHKKGCKFSAYSQRVLRLKD